MRKVRNEKTPSLELVLDDDGLFITFMGLRIIERRPDSTGSHTMWVAIEPGWRVFGGEGEGEPPTTIIGPDGPVLAQ